jgi:hypothetical protein
MIVHFERKKKESKQTETYYIRCRPHKNCHYFTNIFFFSIQGTRTDEKVSKHADKWEWMRAEDLNAAEMKLSTPIEWL